MGKLKSKKPKRKRSFFSLLGIAMLAILIFTGCSGEKPLPSPETEDPGNVTVATEFPTEEATETQEPTVAPTEAPSPSPTLEPTATPEPTPTEEPATAEPHTEEPTEEPPAETPTPVPYAGEAGDEEIIYFTLGKMDSLSEATEEIVAYVTDSTVSSPSADDTMSDPEYARLKGLVETWCADAESFDYYKNGKTDIAQTHNSSMQMIRAILFNLVEDLPTLIETGDIDSVIESTGFIEDQMESIRVSSEEYLSEAE
ncbi:MAG: hypothetical protein LBT59_03530 [Clostridiales bacterium]|nr:hypothetical protein [Clostridiales bacterium]